MQCPRCKTENRQGARFCGKCGAPLSLVCPQCGTELPPDLRFCDSCGSEVSTRPEEEAPAAADDAVSRRLQRLVPKEYAERLLATRGQVPAERRLVTMLFSDVKGSTAMAEDLDPEDVLEIMDGAFDVLIEPIYRYEGTLARLMGDAVLAFFGAPIAHEDDPERAIRAALEITAGAAEYAEKLQRERDIEGFKVRVGINTGLVVVGEVGSDLRVEYTAMGDAINLAARMESAAEPGTVLISEATHKLIAPLFDTEVLGPISVKGKAEPVAVYRVLAAKPVSGKVRGIPGLESALVGREAEFAALQEALQRLQAGLGGIVTIVGEAGIGKSRLVAECRTDWQSVLQWVEGRSLSYGTSIAYILWLDILRELLGVTAEDSPQTVRDILHERVQVLCAAQFNDVYPYLARLMSLPLEGAAEAIIRDLEGEQLKAATFQAVETLLQCAASQRPLVLVCEDLHWADHASIELLELLLALTDRTALLLIGAFRPRKKHGSWRIKEAAARTYGHRHTDIWLKPLSASDNSLLVDNLLRMEQLQPALKQRILDVAEGNPFYVEEIIRSLIDQQAIVYEEATGHWQATKSAVEIPIPDTLHGVLLARIDRLQEDTRRVLQMASVIGRLFLYRVLAAIAEEERRLDEHLLTLQREEMIRERARIPELEYIFKHELTREAAYNGLLKKERRSFHCQVAEALERLFPDRVEEQPGLLAHHWERAGDAEKATEYLLRAGDQARLLYAHREAIDYYERALTLLKEQKQHERAARTLMKLGLTYHTAFDFARSREAYEEGFALWQRASLEKPAVRPAPAPHALRIPLLHVDRPRTLDPTMGQAEVEGLFSGLVQETPERDVVPDVARNWEMLEGGRRYVFHLRDDVRWSDGAAVTAGDFEFAWKRVLNPATGAPYAQLLYAVRGAKHFNLGDTTNADHVAVRALNDLTLEVELEEPTGYLLQLLTQGTTFAVPRHVVEVHGKAWADPQNLVSNGPFRLEAWRPGESIALVRNHEYHGRLRGNAQRVHLTFIQDPSTLLDLYESGEVDVLRLFYAMPAAHRKLARQRHAEEYVTAPSLSTFYIAFDVSQSPFDDVRVRQAFAMATDRERIAAVAWEGYPLPATGGLVPPALPAHSPGIALPYDPDQARQLLAGAGYPHGSGFPTVRFRVGKNEVLQANFEYLQAQWRENLQVNVALETVERAAHYASPQQQLPHISFVLWGADYPDPDSFLRVALSWYQTHWQHQAYHSLVERASRVTDQEERMSLYGQAERILVREAPVVPVAYVRFHTLVKPWVKNYPGPWRDVIIEPH